MTVLHQIAFQRVGTIDGLETMGTNSVKPWTQTGHNGCQRTKEVEEEVELLDLCEELLKIKQICCNSLSQKTHTFRKHN